jgi:hypothetical protein
MPSLPTFADGWSHGQPDAIVEMPIDFDVPAEGEVPVTDFYVATPFTHDVYVKALEVRPGTAGVVHHAGLYVLDRIPEGAKLVNGRIVDANGMSLGSMGGTAFTNFPGMDQVTPILPDRPVKPGDEWDKHFSQSFPFGHAKIEYTAHSTFDRYEEVGGVRAAVITTDFDIPLDFTIDLGDVMKAFGGGAGGAGLSDKNGTMSYEGKGSFEQTSWLDLEDKQLLKGSTDGSFDMTISMPMLSSQLGTDHISMSATFSLALTRR